MVIPSQDSPDDDDEEEDRDPDADSELCEVDGAPLADNEGAAEASLAGGEDGAAPRAADEGDKDAMDGGEDEVASEGSEADGGASQASAPADEGAMVANDGVSHAGSAIAVIDDSPAPCRVFDENMVRLQRLRQLQQEMETTRQQLERKIPDMQWHCM